MPRQPATGRPGTPVVPTGWSAAHRPAIETTLQATCTLRHPGRTGGVFDKNTGTYTGGTLNANHYAGPCDVIDMQAEEALTIVGGEEISAVGYLVKLPYDAAPAAKVDDVVTITAAGPNGDPSLVGLVLAVDSIIRDARAWSRYLVCTENQS